MEWILMTSSEKSPFLRLLLKESGRSERIKCRTFAPLSSDLWRISGPTRVTEIWSISTFKLVTKMWRNLFFWFWVGLSENSQLGIIEIWYSIKLALIYLVNNNWIKIRICKMELAPMGVLLVSDWRGWRLAFKRSCQMARTAKPSSPFHLSIIIILRTIDKSFFLKITAWNQTLLKCRVEHINYLFNNVLQKKYT